MKKILIAAALMAAACSCTKEGTARFEGYYSYKTSGTISFEATSAASSESELAPDEMTFSISPESGLQQACELRTVQLRRRKKP